MSERLAERRNSGEAASIFLLKAAGVIVLGPPAIAVAGDLFLTAMVGEPVAPLSGGLIDFYEDRLGL